MLSDVMEHFGLSKSFRHVDAFETEHHRQLLKDLAEENSLSTRAGSSR